MKQLLLICAVVALVGGCASPNWVSDSSDPDNVKIEKAIRNHYAVKKPTDELTKVDLEKVTKLNLYNKQLTDVKGLEKLTQLELLYLNGNQLTEFPKGLEKLTKLMFLNLRYNPLTKAQIDQLKKALPNCKIHSNPTK